jgi:hypothetical protein
MHFLFCFPEPALSLSGFIVFKDSEMKCLPIQAEAEHYRITLRMKLSTLFDSLPPYSGISSRIPPCIYAITFCNRWRTC